MGNCDDDFSQIEEVAGLVAVHALLRGELESAR